MVLYLETAHMASAHQQQPFTALLLSIEQLLIEWERDKNKIVAQIKSMLNLQEQLDAIKRSVKNLKN